MEGYKYYKGMFDMGWRKEFPRVNVWHGIYHRLHYNGSKVFIDQNKHGILHGPIIKFKYN